MADKSTEPANMRVLRFPQLKQRVGYCRMHIDRLEKDGKFPKRVRLGENSVGWLEHEVDAWLAAKVKARDTTTSETQVAA